MAFGPQVRHGLLPRHAAAEMGALARHRHRRHHRLAVPRQGRDRHRDARHPRRADLGAGVPADAGVRPRLPPHRAPARREEMGALSRHAAGRQDRRHPRRRRHRRRAGAALQGVRHARRRHLAHQAAGRRASTRSIRAPRSRRPRPSSTISCCCCRSRTTAATSSTTRVLAAMKPTAFLINLARGGVLDEDALIARAEREAARGRGARCARDRAAAGRQPALVDAERDHHAAHRRLLRRLSARRRDAVRAEPGAFRRRAGPNACCIGSSDRVASSLAECRYGPRAALAPISPMTSSTRKITRKM